MYEYRCDEQAEGSTRLAYTGLRGGLEHLKIETRFLDEKFLFASVMRVCDLEAIGPSSMFKLIRKAAALARMLPTLALSCEENNARRKWMSPLVGCAS
jgi:hypothetical protein